MRCFVAVDLDNTLKEKIIEIQSELTGLDVKLIEPENLHFTLKFLDEIDSTMIEKVSQSLENLTGKQQPFEMLIEGAGVFPGESFINVVWLGAPLLLPLQEKVNATLKGLFMTEKPIPHLTIARVRSQIHRKEIMEFISKQKKIGAMTVDKIKLKKSTLTMSGPVYEDIVVFNLR